MINSIGLPNKGLARYLARTCPTGSPAHARPRPAAPRPGAAHHQRHGLERRGARAAGGAPASEREEIAAIELNVSCPNVRRASTSAPTPTARAASCAQLRPLHRQAADREAHAQHRRRRRLRAGGAGGWRRRGLADQHAARDGARAHARTRAAARGLARWRHRRALRPRDARPSRSRRWPPSPRACRSRSSAWAASRAHAHARELLDVGRHAGRGRHRELPRSAAGRRIAGGLEAREQPPPSSAARASRPALDPASER